MHSKLRFYYYRRGSLKIEKLWIEVAMRDEVEFLVLVIDLHHGVKVQLFVLHALDGPDGSLVLPNFLQVAFSVVLTQFLLQASH